MRLAAGLPELMAQGPEARARVAVKRLLAQVTSFLVVDTEQGFRPGRGGTRVTPGLSDLILVGHGRIVFVEMKSQKGRQTPEQRAFQEAVERSGGTYLLWRSDVDAWMWLEDERIVKGASR